MKSRGGKSQRREEKKKEDQKRESLRRKIIKVREKVGKSRNVVFFQWFEAPEGRKVGSLKRRVRSQLARWEMKIARRCGAKHISKTKCRKHQLRTTFGSWDVEKVHAVVARSTFRSQMYKAHQVRTTFGNWDVEKVHAVVARSTFRSQNVQGTPGSDHFWKLRCRKSARRCGAKHIWKSKVQKTEGVGAPFDAQMSRGTFEEDLQNAFSVAPAVQATCSSELLGGPGADFLRGVAFWSIRSSGLLRWFCATGAALCMTWHHFFVAGPLLQTGGVEKSQNAKVRGRQPYTQVSMCEGSLTELLRCWCFQLQKMRKSRRIASFLTLSSSKMEEVLQNCCVFDVVKFKNWGSLAE